MKFTSTLLLFMLFLLTGCASYSKNGVTRYIVFGFGVISINNTNQNLATIRRATIIGLYGESAPSPRIGTGFAHFTEIEVKTNSDILIDVSNNKISIPCTNH